MLHITTGNGKMKAIPSLNTDSLSNDFCRKMSEKEETVCSRCYSNRYLTYRPTLREHTDMNSEILSMESLNMSDLPVTNNLYFRFHSFGELINDQHYKNLIKMCKKNPKTTFSLWSKRKAIIQKFTKPENLILIYSSLFINPMEEIVPEGFDKVFSVYTRDFAKKERIRMNCTKACITCLKCYDLEEKTVFIREIVK